MRTVASSKWSLDSSDEGKGWLGWLLLPAHPLIIAYQWCFYKYRSVRFYQHSKCRGPAPGAAQTHFGSLLSSLCVSASRRRLLVQQALRKAKERSNCQCAQAPVLCLRRRRSDEQGTLPSPLLARLPPCCRLSHRRFRTRKDWEVSGCWGPPMQARSAFASARERARAPAPASRPASRHMHQAPPAVPLAAPTSAVLPQRVALRKWHLLLSRTAVSGAAYVWWAEWLGCRPGRASALAGITCRVRPLSSPCAARTRFGISECRCWPTWQSAWAWRPGRSRESPWGSDAHTVHPIAPAPPCSGACANPMHALSFCLACLQEFAENQPGSHAKSVE